MDARVNEDGWMHGYSEIGDGRWEMETEMRNGDGDGRWKQ